MNALIGNRCDAFHIANHLKATFPCLLLVAFSAFSGDEILAASKPTINVRFEMDQGLFNFEDVDNKGKEAIIDQVCEESRKKWGFLAWCEDSDGGTSTATWTVRLAVVPRPPAEDDELTKRVFIQHFLRPPQNESDLDPLQSTELYDYHQPKPINDPGDLLEKILWGIAQQFQSQEEWEKTINQLKTIPLTGDLQIFTRKGRKFITVPYSLCDLGLEEHVKFKVELTIDDFFEDDFDLQKIGVVDPELDPNLKDFIVGKVTRWNVNSEVVEPNPIESPSVESEKLLELLTKYEKSVFIDEFDIGSGCAVNNTGLVTDLGN